MNKVALCIVLIVGLGCNRSFFHPKDTQTGKTVCDLMEGKWKAVDGNEEYQLKVKDEVLVFSGVNGRHRINISCHENTFSVGKELYSVRVNKDTLDISYPDSLIRKDIAIMAEMKFYRVK